MKKRVLILCILGLVLINLSCQKKADIKDNATEPNRTDQAIINAYEADAPQKSFFEREINIMEPIMNGSDIKNLQERLIELGFTGIGEADGYYGPKTADVILFIKTALGLAENYKHFSFSDEPPDCSVNKELFEFIFDNKNKVKLNSISLFRFFYNDPNRSPKMTGLEESVSFREATEEGNLQDWEETKKEEYYYETGSVKVFIKEIIKRGHEYESLDRDFILPNGLQITENEWAAESFYGTSFLLSE